MAAMRMKTWAAGAASVAMLAAVSSVNIWPSLKSHNYHLALVQIALTITVAISRHIPVFDPDTRNRIVIAFMVINGWFAFQGAEQLRDGDAEAHRQYVAWAQELDGKDGKSGKRGELTKLGEFTPTEESQVKDARNVANAADTEKGTTGASANTARTRFNDCKVGCNKDKLKKEAERLEGVAAQKDTDAKTAHNKLEQLSGWRTLTEQAAPIKARITELEKNLSDHPDKGEVSTERWLLQEMFALFLAGVIELANRYAPATIFRFIMEQSETSETQPLGARRKAEPEPARTQEMPGKPAPSRRKSTGNATGNVVRKSAGNATGNVVQLFRQRPTAAQIRAMISTGKSKPEIAAHFRYSERQIRNILREDRTEIAALRSS
jgi:hypothetical protein